MAMLSTILRTILRVTLYLAIPIVSVGLLATSKNYCWKTNTFNSTAAILQLVLENQLQSITVFKVDARGTTIAAAVAAGKYPTEWTDIVAYPDVEQFKALNSNWYRISPQDDFGIFQPNWMEYLAGWRYGLEMTWRRMYLDDSGTIKPFDDPNATSRLDRSYRDQRLLVSSCGATRQVRLDRR